MRKSAPPNYTSSDFPEPGSVFVAPLPDGRLCAGRVLRNEFKGGAQAVLLAASSWIGDKEPLLVEPGLRDTAVSTHHTWQSRQNIFWSHYLMPADFRIIGKIELSEADRQASSNCRRHSQDLRPRPEVQHNR